MEFNNCVRCGGKLSKRGEGAYVCADCGKETYNNVATCATVYILNDTKDQVLMGIRGIEPQKGKLDTIGGFLNPGEQPKDTAIREVMEETGLKIRILDLVDAITSSYIGSTYTTAVCYTAEIIEGDLNPNDDVAELLWLSLDDVEKHEYSFDSIKPSLLYLREWLDKND